MKSGDSFIYSGEKFILVRHAQQGTRLVEARVGKRVKIGEHRDRGTKKAEPVYDYKYAIGVGGFASAKGFDYDTALRCAMENGALQLMYGHEDSPATRLV